MGINHKEVEKWLTRVAKEYLKRQDIDKASLTRLVLGEEPGLGVPKIPKEERDRLERLTNHCVEIEDDNSNSIS